MLPQHFTFLLNFLASYHTWPSAVLRLTKTANAQYVANTRCTSLSPSQRKLEDLLAKQKEVSDQLNMAEDDVAQVNDMLPMLHDSKEVSVQCVLPTV